MNTVLTEVIIENFRSIGGSVTIPLHAPIVLLYGANGAGKTTVMSAIELALTGHVSSLQRADGNYRSHLLHKETTNGRVSLSSQGLDAENAHTSEFLINDKGASGAALLSSVNVRFFSERCSLPQSALGRLLEIYQTNSKDSASPLTQFVNDLLGVDRLNALADGLEPVLDKRNFRSHVPAYGRLESELTSIESRLRDAQRQLAFATDQATVKWKHFVEALQSIGVEASQLSETMPVILSDILPPDESSALAESSVLVDELELLALRYLKIDEESLGNIAALEAEDSAAQSALAKWNTESASLSSTIDRARELFPDLPIPASVDPQFALQTAVDKVEKEFLRCNEELSSDEKMVEAVAKLEISTPQLQELLNSLDTHIHTLTDQSARLAGVLSDLLSAANGNICPVCDRDFTETGTNLIQHLQVKIDRLEKNAVDVNALTTQRSKLQVEIRASEKTLRDCRSLLLRDAAKDDLRERIALLGPLVNSLISLTSQAASGAELMRSATDTRARLNVAKALRSEYSEIERQLDAASKNFALPPREAGTPISVTLGDVLLTARIERDRLSERRTARMSVEDFLAEHRRFRGDCLHQESIKDELAKRQLQLRASIQAADASREFHKRVHKAAVEARSGAIAQVFNHSLNKIWRDLFIRLAPDEPFVPAFKVPSQVDRRVSATLETHHRSGIPGGPPGSMLSAGNLNTAALTLFLALHLSVEARLPWLLLDDPVQSMDDVHISQFAALLRVISKNIGRQIVIAVHDKQLFDYLSLELSPAFPEDRLITVELNRSVLGKTEAVPLVRKWKPDATFDTPLAIA